MKKLILIAIICHASVFGLLDPVLACPKAFNVNDFGAVADGKTDSGPGIRKAIAQAIAAGPGAKVVLASGVYYISTLDPNTKANPYCFLIEKAGGLTIEGSGGTEILVGHPRTGVFEILAGKNISIRNLTIDVNVLPFTQGSIIAVNPEENHFDFRIEPGYPLLSDWHFEAARDLYFRWGMIFDPLKDQLKAGVADHIMIQSWDQVDQRTWRMHAKTSEHESLKMISPGDRYVHLARSSGQSSVCVLKSENVIIENITVYASPCESVILDESSRVTVRALQARKRPGTSRLISTDSDGIHLNNCLSAAGTNFIFENCYFEGLADDSFNIHSWPDIVTRVFSDTRIAVAAARQGGRFISISAGDSLQILDPCSGAVLGETTAASVENVDGMKIVQLSSPVKGMRAGSEYTNATHVYNLAMSGSGYIIRNNYIENNRRYGMLIRTGNGIIEGNVIKNLAGNGIVISYEPGWPEGPAASNVVIRNNRIVSCGYSDGNANRKQEAAIVVKGRTVENTLANAHTLRNINIENNEFVDPLGACIFIGSSKGVKICNNKSIASSQSPILNRTASIVLEECDDILIDGYKIVDPRPQIVAAIQIMPSVINNDHSVSINNIQSNLAESSKPVIDLRKSAQN